MSGDPGGASLWRSSLVVCKRLVVSFRVGAETRVRCGFVYQSCGSVVVMLEFLREVVLAPSPMPSP